MTSSTEGLRQKLAAQREHLRLYKAVRREVVGLRPSQYDISRTCNLTCEGCLFFLGGDYRDHDSVADPQVISDFFAAEAARGVNYGQFAGAEPALRKDILRIAARYIPQGVVFTNGTIKIDRDLPYCIHVSVWGVGEMGAQLRGADVLGKALRNYRGDPRATFIFTINARNIDDIAVLAGMCEDHQVKLSFSHFSPTAEYLQGLQQAGEADREYLRSSTGEDNLMLGADDLLRARRAIALAMQAHPNTIVYSDAFADWIHKPQGVHEGGAPTRCSARVTPKYRHFNTDFSDAGDVKCCAPNIECGSCRLYAQSLYSALARPDEFSDGVDVGRWLDVWEHWRRLFLPRTAPAVRSAPVSELSLQAT